MSPITTALAVAVACCAGAALGALVVRARPGAAAHQARDAAARAVAEQSERMVELAESRFRLLEQGSRDQWRASSQAVVDNLTRYADRLGALEQQRQRESAVLSHAVEALRRSNEDVRAEARNLANAMTDSRVRGSWGEMQLRRVLENAGMVAHADFVEQRGVGGTRSLRPDVVVRLPNGRCVVVDAKAPLDAYLRAADTDDDAARAALVDQHGAAVAAHVQSLSSRRYSDAVDGSVDFVVMFVPGDAFLSAAFEARPDLLEAAAARDVILASPSTLLAFLRGVACGWRERHVAEQAAEIARLGRELHERMSVFAGHLGAVGSSLERAVDSYNDAVGSFERRLVVTARRFEDHGAGSARELTPPVPVDDPVRRLTGGPGAGEVA